MCLERTYPVIFHSYPSQDVVDSLQCKETTFHSAQVPQILRVLVDLLTLCLEVLGKDV